MKILFLHQNFPAQFVHIAVALQKAGHACLALIPATNNRPTIIETVRYNYVPEKQAKSHLAETFLLSASRGAAAAQAMFKLKQDGFSPELVIAHCGWGESLFVKDIWPTARLLVYSEFFYASSGADVDFDPEFQNDRSLKDDMRLRLRNASLLQAMVDADTIVTPTRWQASRFPEGMRNRIHVIHEGVDTNVLKPDLNASLRLGRDNVSLSADDEVVTFVSRNLEPYRGYHCFMRALPDILRARPKARAIIVGGTDVSYGARLRDDNWKSYFLRQAEPRLDMRRVHFVGTVPHSLLKQLFQTTTAHVYLTYPFVLSWSMLEAMSCGALIIGSRTAPVEEVITHNINGLLVDFFDIRALSDTVIQVLQDRGRFAELRGNARRYIVNHFDLERTCLPAWFSLIAQTM